MVRVPVTALRAAKAPDEIMTRASVGLRLVSVMATLAGLIPSMNCTARVGLVQRRSVWHVTVGLRLEFLTLTPMIVVTCLLAVFA